MSSSSTISDISSPSSPFQSAQPRQSPKPTLNSSPSSSASPSNSLSPQPTSHQPPTVQDEFPSDSSSLSSSLSPSLSPAGPVSSTRPNKFQGPASTWRTWTAEERELAASLNQIQAADLSIHLYNAFALKKRAGVRHSGKKRKRSPTGVEEGEGEGSNWAPPKVWTAWPMRADEVPREDESRKWEDGDSLQRPLPRKLPRQGDAVGELLVARVMKKAKERFEQREWADSEPDRLPKEEEKGARKTERLRNTKGLSNPPLIDSAASGHGILGVSNKPLKPVMLADDALATSLLQPSTQHILTKLDDLLLGLHRARAAYATPNARPNSTRHNDDPTSARNQTQSRPRSPSLSSDSASNYSTTGPSSSRPRAHRRRPSTPPPPSRPSSAMSISPPPPTPPHRPHRTYKSTFGPRDWSDVLGMASLTGWDATVVEKAAQRCSRLFGEGMAFRRFDDRGREGEGSILGIFRPKAGDVKGGDDEGEKGEETHGSIHIDGFLQPIEGKRSWKYNKFGRVADASRVIGRYKRRDVKMDDDDEGSQKTSDDSDDDNEDVAARENNRGDDDTKAESGESNDSDEDVAADGRGDEIDIDDDTKAQSSEGPDMEESDNDEAEGQDSEDVSAEEVDV